ncbi:tRNA (adenine(22)-N(1))-methyltransferase TrmK [Clostridium sp.]|uniref:tRNA (adenine(22)-N(1))-methyltransferase TrmK n=1 Tax=Clostridium sp. TaxID=1506 RepID=UPI003464C0BD
MDISLRLNTIVNLIDKCGAIVDVGTDHGYVPIEALKRGICEKAIASDINKGPVNKVKLNVSLEGLASNIQCRLGSGLKTVERNEVQGAVIAGMGGNLIRDIICDSYEVFKNLDFAILQPTQNPEVLREFLFKKGISILDEKICLDEGIYYEIIKVSPKVKGNSKEVLDPIYFEVSPYILERRDPLDIEYINSKIEKYNSILEKIKDDSEGALKRKDQITEKLQKLKEMVSCL